MLKKLFGKILKKEHQSYAYEILSDEQLIFHVNHELFRELETLNATEWILHQHITLKMLVEQGLAEQAANGFIVPSDVVSEFDLDTLELLGLPSAFSGYVGTDIKGEVRRANFSLNLNVQIEGIKTFNWTLEGPFLRLSSSKAYSLPLPYFQAFHALKKHQEGEKNEFNNLKLIHTLQNSVIDGANIQLSHFEQLDVIKPDRVPVQAIEDDYGNLILSPHFNSAISPEDYHSRKGQIVSGQSTALRSKDKIVLLNDSTLEAVQEIISNEVIPKAQVKSFLASPSAYLDASLVDLDLGFSLRVKGATKFKHGYFGEQNESEIDWFGDISQLEQRDLSDVGVAIDTPEDLELLKLVLDDARAVGADVIEFSNKQYLINSPEEVDKTLDKIERKLESLADDSVSEKNNVSDSDTAVVDIELNDEDVTLSSPKIEGAIQDVLYKGTLDWSNYHFSPFPHQDTGVRWMLGIKEQVISDLPVTGAILADDMGLGKTFMSLAAIHQSYELNPKKTKKPALIVAPLSLLENWKAEVDKFFINSPFDDVVILQSSGELRKFKLGGAKQETKMQQFSEDESLDDSHIKYALKFGKYYGNDRLDMPKRLVITTYQTLRDYQFSLCKIDWSYVIFDEAQNTKNPNALQTRAAKGIKADFKVMVTGTPVENNLCDFWCLMDTAMPGYLGSYQEFKARYIAKTDDEDEKARLGKKLRSDVGALMLRRLKEDNLENLPSKTVHVGLEGDLWHFNPELSSSLAGEQLAAYDRASASIEDSVGSALAVLFKLRNISLHHDLLYKEKFQVPSNAKAVIEHMGLSGKLASTIDTLRLIESKGEKVIIFAINKRLQTYLSMALGKMFDLGVVPIINGDTKAVAGRKGVETRSSIIKSYENKLGFNIIIMSPVAAGTGLTVVGANHVIHLERHWNPAKEAQATDRAYRIGQKKDVHVYIPMLHHPEKVSFDVNLHHLLNCKTQIKDAVVTPESVSMKASDWGLG